MSFQAKIIADSKNEFGNRITTFLVTFPRIILAELNTHRMLSKNSASSRAIPFTKMVKAVEDNPFIPIAWQKDHKGMQGSEYANSDDASSMKDAWLKARDFAIMQAKHLNNDLNVTKQLCNRLLEPFMWHTVLITGTDFENFFALRAHEAAEIHMQKLAYVMLEEYNKSIPKQLKAGEWHIPYGDDIILPPTIPIDPGYTLDEGVWIRKVKISTARCARTSYTLVGEESKEHDYEADIKLHDRLLESGHLSPFEHCARAMTKEEFQRYFIRYDLSKYNNTIDIPQWMQDENSRKLGIIVVDHSTRKPLWFQQFGWNGNIRGFIQYRKTIEGENKNDDRVIKK